MMNNVVFKLKMQLIEKVYGRFDLIISKKNEVYIKVETEPNIARELQTLHLKCLTQGLCPHIKINMDGKTRLTR